MEFTRVPYLHEGMEKKNGIYYNEFYEDYYKDPFLHSYLIKGKNKHPMAEVLHV